MPNREETGKFVAYRDAIFLAPLSEGRGRVHTFTPWHEYRDGAPLQNGARWQGSAVRIFGGANGGYVHIHYLGHPACKMHGAWLNYTIAALFKTSTDISSSQFVYEEGGGINGLNIYIRDRKVFCGAWIQVSDTTGNAHSLFLSIDIDVNKKYFVANVFEGKKQHSAFLNNVKYGRANISWKMLSHSGTCQFGRNSGDTVTDISVQNEANYSTRDSFNGLLLGLFIWEKTLSDSEVKSAYYHTKRNVKPSCITRRGVYRAVRNTGIEVDGNMTNVAEVMC